MGDTSKRLVPIYEIHRVLDRRYMIVSKASREAKSDGRESDMYRHNTALHEIMTIRDEIAALVEDSSNG